MRERRSEKDSVIEKEMYMTEDKERVKSRRRLFAKSDTTPHKWVNFSREMICQMN